MFHRQGPDLSPRDLSQKLIQTGLHRHSLFFCTHSSLEASSPTVFRALLPQTIGGGMRMGLAKRARFTGGGGGGGWLVG